MMTKQAELKQQAYASNLKSRALSVLIYLIDRSNADLTCFPAIPTMAVQLHISVSTVKRALKELVDAGFLQKDSRFRENNRGQTSNLYTLIFREEVPTPDNDNNPKHGDFIEPAKQSTPKGECKAEHITFSIIASKQNQCNYEPQETADQQPPQHELKPCIPHIYTPIHLVFIHGLKLPQILSTGKENAEQFLPCVANLFIWMGAGVNLQPP
ncbi:helix-turn-helix domain-containing protein [Lacrimispora brassicae]